VHRRTDVRAALIYQHATRQRDKSLAAALGKHFKPRKDDSE
jgi:hypothetical protein